MKIVVIGGTGLIGSKTVERLRARGHEVLAASPASGVDTLTGEGLAQALAGAQVVIDLANSPSFEDAAAMAFFTTAGRNLLAAEKAAGVGHHVALSVVGTDRLQASGYFRAKQAQEALIRASGVAYSIVHSTQFFEFMGAIVQSAVEGGEVHLSPAALQPISADDVADAMTEVALGQPIGGVIEIAGPERAPLSDFVVRFMAQTHDGRAVVVDPHARYFGLELDDRSLVPDEGARLGATHFDNWLSARGAQ
jgi:uncharacterized protein YbjT (DUF2867 family)